MASFSYGSRTIENVGVGILEHGYAVLDGSVVGHVDQSVFFNSDGRPCQIGGQLLIKGTPRGYIFSELSLEDGAKYELSGTIVPTNSVINISLSSVNAYEELSHNVLYSAQGDNDGNWKISVDKWPGDAIIWCNVVPSAASFMSATFSYKADRVLEDNSTITDASSSTGGGSGGSVGGPCVYCNGAGMVDDTCPSCLGTGLTMDVCTTCGGDGIVNSGTGDIYYNGKVVYQGVCVERQSYGVTAIPFERPLPVGRGFVVSVDGTIDTCRSKLVLTGEVAAGHYFTEQGVYLGNYYLFNQNTADTGEDYFFAVGYDGTGYTALVVTRDESDHEFIISDVSCPACQGLGLLEMPDQCPECDGNGIKIESNTCGSCGGSGTYSEQINCPTCDGSGGEDGDCPTCNGYGSVEDSRTCDECNGSGSTPFEIPCTYCSSTGANPMKTTCNQCNGYTWVSITCPACNGTGSDGTCLTGDTLITLADGSFKRLDQITEYDVVMAGDGSPTRVLGVLSGLWNFYHTVYTFEDGITVKEVRPHRFYNVEQGFWQKLSNWKIGEHAIRQDGAYVALISKRRVIRAREMFGIWTESGDYFANGLLAGETAANQKLLGSATLEQAVNMVETIGNKFILKLSGLEGMFP